MSEEVVSHPWRVVAELECVKYLSDSTITGDDALRGRKQVSLMPLYVCQMVAQDLEP
jgi:hypothetical protein